MLIASSTVGSLVLHFVGHGDTIIVKTFVGKVRYNGYSYSSTPKVYSVSHGYSSSSSLTHT